MAAEDDLLRDPAFFIDDIDSISDRLTAAGGTGHCGIDDPGLYHL